MVDQLALAHRPAADATFVDRGAYPFRDRWFRGQEGVIHYVDEGSGPIVLFVHGTPTWSFEWRHVIRAVSKRHRCIAIDHLGFGLSERPPGADYSPEAHARRFHEVASALVGEARDVTVVVHDFGGPIALPWVIERARAIAGLVVVNSWMWSFDDDPVLARRARLAGGWLARLLYRWANASLRLLMPSVYGDRAKLTPAVHAQYLAPFRDRGAREDILFALARSLHGSRAHFDGLWRRRDELSRIPSLVVWGEKDGAFGPHALDRWRSALPHARVVTSSRAGHWPHEEEPETVVAELEAFLDAISPAATRA
ncbi:MAG: alpha/beta fold hydrolase [Deltaproteobacteria bacterium]|nr:alpha/beta fold hydrolase [Deltaproteobacteria bacterium]